jgi:hypothetical protein
MIREYGSKGGEECQATRTSSFMNFSVTKSNSCLFKSLVFTTAKGNIFYDKNFRKVTELAHFGNLNFTAKTFVISTS